MSERAGYRVGLAAGVAILVVGLAVSLVAAPRARACGFWYLHERGRAPAVGFYVQSVARRGEGGLLRITRRGAELRAVDRRGRQLGLRDGVLRRDGRRIGRLEGGSLRIGERSWTIRVTRRPPGGPGPDIYRWTVQVRRDGERVAHAERAMAFCKCGRCDAEQERRDITARTALYLAWRSS